MNSITVFIADPLQITRLGLRCILKQLNYPVAIKEISRPDKLYRLSAKGNINVLIISSLFLSHLNKTPHELSELFIPFSARLLFCNQQTAPEMLSAFNELIGPNEPEKSILNKFDRQLATLLQLHPSSQTGDNEISHREKDVLRLIAKGFTNKEIAEKLFISLHTVVTHRKNLSAKLGIKTIAGLTIYAVINQLISLDDIQKD